MRLKHIRIDKLFGIFDYDIPMNLDERITIMHGPNGCGKTSILRLLDGLFRGKNKDFRSIPFSSFQVEFDSGSVLEIRKESELGQKTLDIDDDSEPIHQLRKSRQKPPILTFKLRKNGKEESYSEAKRIRAGRHDSTFILNMIDRTEGLRRVGPNEWLHLQANEILSYDEVIEEFAQNLPDDLLAEVKDEPEWLTEVRRSLRIRFIQTHRLQTEQDYRHARAPRYRQEPMMVPAVKRYAEELATKIQEELAKYASFSQSLDRSFPKRLVSETPPAEYTKAELFNRLNELEKKRSHLVDAGLLDPEKDQEFQISDIKADQRAVLAFYVNDVENKLSKLNAIADRIELLKKVINTRFEHKQMKVDKEEGFTFITDRDRPIEATKLSSGEQHQLVLLYELLFNVEKNRLVLIDEPEISLHLAWQKQFLKDLEEMANLSQLDVLVATHSPQIISDRWDLTVELKSL